MNLGVSLPVSHNHKIKTNIKAWNMAHFQEGVDKTRLAVLTKYLKPNIYICSNI